MNKYSIKQLYISNSVKKTIPSAYRANYVTNTILKNEN